MHSIYNLNNLVKISQIKLYFNQGFRILMPYFGKHN